MRSEKMKTLPIFVLVIVLALFAVSCCAGTEETDTKSNSKKEKSGYSSKNTEYVEAVFAPTTYSQKISSSDLDAAKKIIKTRFKNLGIKDYKIKIDEDYHQITVKFPKPGAKDDYDAGQIADILAAKGSLEFYEGRDNSSGEPFMTGDAVKEASPQYTEENGYVVSLKFNSYGADAFYEATDSAATNGNMISIYFDDELILAAGCNQAISGGEAIIYGNFTEKQAKLLANQINAGALPFALEIQDITGDD